MIRRLRSILQDLSITAVGDNTKVPWLYGLDIKSREKKIAPKLDPAPDSPDGEKITDRVRVLLP